MRITIVEIILALLIGIITIYCFFMLYGILAAISVEYKLYNWIISVPHSYSKFCFFIHGIIVQFIALLPLSAILGGALGFVVRKSPGIFGVVSFLAAIATYIIIQFVYYDFGFTGLNYTPLWVYLINIILLAMLFLLFPIAGHKIRLLRRKGTK